METLFQTLGPFGILAALAMLIGVIVFALLWSAKNKVKIKGRNGEVFQLGDNTPFEKTNARFKQLCADMGDIRNEVVDLRGRFDSTHQDVKAIAGDLRTVRMDQQKQLFYDGDQRIDERLAAGLRFIECGGNGQVKKDVIECARTNRAIYDAFILGAPGLKLEPQDINTQE
jgi:hypothetical protein